VDWSRKSKVFSHRIERESGNFLSIEISNTLIPDIGSHIESPVFTEIDRFINPPRSVEGSSSICVTSLSCAKVSVANVAKFITSKHHDTLFTSVIIGSTDLSKKVVSIKVSVSSSILNKSNGVVKKFGTLFTLISKLWEIGSNI